MGAPKVELEDHNSKEEGEKENAPINVGSQFYPSLVNRDKQQGEGIFTAIQFRNKFMLECLQAEWWKDLNSQIVFNFKSVNEISSPWANEAFAYFMDPAIGFNIGLRKFLSKIKFEGISSVHKQLIIKELENGYRGDRKKLE